LLTFWKRKTNQQLINSVSVFIRKCTNLFQTDTRRWAPVIEKLRPGKSWSTRSMIQKWVFYYWNRIHVVCFCLVVRIMQYQTNPL
jgi:hypothetical protein